MTSKEKQVGLHLIELLITLIIIGIASTAAITIYPNYLKRARHLEANTTLALLAAALEAYHLEHDTYQGASARTLAVAGATANPYYTFKVEYANDSAYQLLAKPKRMRTTDGETLVVNSN